MIINRRKVEIHPLYWDDDFEEEYLHEAANIFTKYWLAGYQPEFGRDRPVFYPKTIQDAAICHVHYLTCKLYGAQAVDWKRNCKTNIAPYFRSAVKDCDSMFIYAISEEGTALLLAIFDKNAHAQLRNNELLRALAMITIEYFKQIGEQPALAQDVMNTLQTANSTLKVTLQGHTKRART